MDPITQSNLVAMHIEELLRERQPRHEAGAPWYGTPAPVIPARPILPALRRRLGALLIQAGRRLSDNPRPRNHALFGTIHR